MPKVGLFLFETSGLLTSWPPGLCSHATTPHMLPLHCATRMLATPSATRQSPVGSAAIAQGAPLAANIAAEKSAIQSKFLGHCNMAQTCACVDGVNEGKTPHWAFSVDETAINRSM
jgi:hypothetical protein